MILYKNWCWYQERNYNQIKKKELSSINVSPKRGQIEDRYIIFEVLKAQELICEAPTKYGSYLKIDPAYK